MKIFKTLFIQYFLSAFVVITFNLCGNSDENIDGRADSLRVDKETINRSIDLVKDDTPILKYLRSLAENEYGGTDHINDADFGINDDENRFLEYKSEKEDRYYWLQFIQVSSEPRKLFIRLSYDKYSMGVDNGYNAFNSCKLIEEKDGSWINVSSELPENWQKDNYTAQYNQKKEQFELYQINFDTETGKELNKKVIETAQWKNDRLEIVSSDVPDKNNAYKIIVAFSITEDVSEDFNYIYNDVDVAFEKFGVHLEYLNLSESKTIKIDNKDLSLELDLTETIAPYEKEELGYLFLEKGKDAKFVKYQESDMIILEAQKYFGLD